MKYRARHRGPVIDRVKARDLLEQGLSNLQVADALGCAPNTISNMKRDLGFPVEARAHRGSTRAELTAKTEALAVAGLKRKHRGGQAKRGGNGAFLFGAAAAQAKPAPDAKPEQVEAVPPNARAGVDSETIAEHAMPRSAVPAGRATFETLAGARRCLWIEGPVVRGAAHLAVACGERTELGCPWCAAHRRRAWTGVSAADKVARVLRVVEVAA